MKVIYDKSIAKILLKDIPLPKGMKPEDVGGIVNGKVFGKDLPSIIEMSDEINKREK